MFDTYNEHMVRGLKPGPDKSKCIHAEITPQGFLRCENRVAEGRPHGYTCQQHQFPPVGNAPARDYDAEHVGGIIIADKRAIARSGRHVN